MAESDRISRKDFLAAIGRGTIGLALGAMLGTESKAAAAAPPLPFALTAAGVLDPKMPGLRGVAIDKKDNVYAAGASGIRIFDRAGKFAREIKTSGPACAVAVDAEANVYAAQRARIEKFSPEGKPLAAWGERGVKPGQLLNVTALAVGERTVYAADSGARTIVRFSLGGDYAGEIEGPNPKDKSGKFDIPSAFFDIALDAEGHLFVGHTGAHRVERYNPNHELVGHWGRFGAGREDFCGCCNPTNIALFADGRVATTEKGVPRLKVHDANGRLLAYVGAGSFPGKAAGMDIAVDSKGRIALVEPVSLKIGFFEMRKN